MFSTLLSKIFLYLIGGIISSLIFCPPCYTGSLDYAIDTLRYYTLIFAVLWETNKFLIRFLDSKLDWIRETRKKLLYNILLLIIVTIPLIFTFVYVAFEIIGPRPLNTTSFSLMVYYSISSFHFFTGLMISLLLNSQNFFTSWKKAIVREEALKQQQITYQLKALVNQVNPHFLFNNLHTLTALVRKDKQLAEQFINQLAQVYRYLLSGNKSNVIFLREEKKFLDAYFFLLNIRFGDVLKIHFSTIPEPFKIAPVTLQMLVENAIKHNIANEQNPLNIYIYEADDYLVVKNNLNLKTSLGYSSGIGLNNIMQRYRLLGKRQVIVEENHEFFIVKLPNLEVV